MKKLMNEQCNYFCLKKSMIYLILWKVLQVFNCSVLTSYIDGWQGWYSLSFHLISLNTFWYNKKFKINTFSEMELTSLLLLRGFLEIFTVVFFLSFHISYCVLFYFIFICIILLYKNSEFLSSQTSEEHLNKYLSSWSVSLIHQDK